MIISIIFLIFFKAERDILLEIECGFCGVSEYVCVCVCVCMCVCECVCVCVCAHVCVCVCVCS